MSEVGGRSTRSSGRGAPETRTSKRKRTVIKDESDEDHDGLGDPDFGSESDEEDVKPVSRKSRKTGETSNTARSTSAKGSVIPKKENAAHSATEQSSLLSKLQPAVVKTVPVLSQTPGRISPKTTSTSITTKSPQRKTSISPKGPPSRAQEDSRSKEETSRVKHEDNPRLREFVAKLKNERQAAAQHSTAPSGAGHPNRTEKERRILDGLGNLCSHYSNDLKFTFIPPNNTGLSNSGVNLAGSFLAVGGSELDFFDLDSKGEVVIQPKPPIFPEELRGMKEHSLQWWGILDPAIGDGRCASTTTDKPEDGGRDRRSNGSSRDHHHHRHHEDRERRPPGGDHYGTHRGRPFESASSSRGPAPPCDSHPRNYDRRRHRR